MDKKEYDNSTIKFLSERFNWDIYFKDRKGNPFTLRINFYGNIQEALDFSKEFAQIKGLEIVHLGQRVEGRRRGKRDKGKQYSPNLQKRIEGKERQGIPLKEKAFWSQRRRQ